MGCSLHRLRGGARNFLQLKFVSAALCPAIPAVDHLRRAADPAGAARANRRLRKCTRAPVHETDRPGRRDHLAEPLIFQNQRRSPQARCSGNYQAKPAAACRDANRTGFRRRGTRFGGSTFDGAVALSMLCHLPDPLAVGDHGERLGVHLHLPAPPGNRRVGRGVAAGFDDVPDAGAGDRRGPASWTALRAAGPGSLPCHLSSVEKPGVSSGHMAETRIGHGNSP